MQGAKFIGLEGMALLVHSYKNLVISLRTHAHPVTLAHLSTHAHQPAHMSDRQAIEKQQHTYTTIASAETWPVIDVITDTNHQ